MSYGKKGILRVTQVLNDGKPIIRDFDAEEWSYEWIKRGYTPDTSHVILRVLHDGDPNAPKIGTFDFVEFSAPLHVEFEYGPD